MPSARIDEIVVAFPELEFCVITAPRAAMRLDEARDRLEDTHQTWVREPETGLWRFDVFREPTEGGAWVCRRDESLRLPYDQVIEQSEDGIPFCRPEIALLFKAKHAQQAKNQADFEAVVPRLAQERRRWLAAALERIHPGHAWIEALS